MKKIKFIHRYRGWSNANPFGKDTKDGHQPGDIVECEEKRAKWFVEESKVQWAEYVVEEKKAKKVEVTSFQPTSERAVVDPKPTKRGPGRPPKGTNKGE